MHHSERSFIYEEDNPQRLDIYLSQKFPEKSRSQFQRLIKEQQITINQIFPRKAGQMLEKGDLVSVVFPPPEDLDLQAEPIALDIIFEDDNVIIINKPAGMVVHPSAGHQTGTLIHALLNYYPFLEGIGGKKRPGIVHRLDKDTSGVLLVAKNEMSHVWLQRQFKQRKVKKQYIALVDGKPATDTGRIIAPIYRDLKQRKKMAIAPEGQGKAAETHYRVVGLYKKHSLLEVIPLTGRTHQIRVHLSAIGVPICGDRVYGYQKESINIKRHFLHAQSLSIRLPGEKEPRDFSAGLPADLQEILDLLSSSFVS